VAERPEAPADGRVRPLSREEFEKLVEKLVKRGHELVVTGRIAEARVPLTQAAEAGDASAALELGATYDPIYLAAHSSVTAAHISVTKASNGETRAEEAPISADTAMARAWYQKAKELGAPNAQERLERLGQNPLAIPQPR
jgi:TPR repeat protein